MYRRRNIVFQRNNLARFRNVKEYVFGLDCCLWFTIKNCDYFIFDLKLINLKTSTLVSLFEYRVRRLTCWNKTILSNLISTYNPHSARFVTSQFKHLRPVRLSFLHVVRRSRRLISISWSCKIIIH